MISKFIKPLFLPALLLAISLMTGCKSSVQHESAEDSETSKVSSNSTIDWESCKEPKYADWFSEFTDIDALECATLDIAIANDSNNTQSLPNKMAQEQLNTLEPTVINLALSRLPSTGNSNQKIGSIITIAGGPGQSGLDVSPINSEAHKRLSKHFDVIGYAPRGVRPTTPSITCSENGHSLEQQTTDFVKGCWEHTPNDLLKVLGADYAVDDVEAIRQALGEEKISLMSYSYGTKIATLYAEKYPNHLRAGVLDGVVNLNDSELQMMLNQNRSMQRTFERFVEHCRQQTDCYFSDTNSLEEAEAKMGTIFQSIEDNEIYDLDEERIWPINLAMILHQLLIWPDQWPILNDFLFLLDKEQYQPLSFMVSASKKTFDISTFTVLLCADGAPSEAEKVDFIKEMKLINNQSTWDNYRIFTDEEHAGVCYSWPIPGTDNPHIPNLAPAVPPLLLIAQTDDPATPYVNAVAMQKFLDATLITRDSDGHTMALFNINECIDNKVVDYFINPQNLKEKHLTCE